MSKSVKILWVLSFLSGIVLMVLMDTYKVESAAIIDNLLFIGSILLVGGWILSFILGSIFNFFPKTNSIKIKKTNKIKKNKQIESDELTVIQFILFYPIATFSVLILLGLISSGFKP